MDLKNLTDRLDKEFQINKIPPDEPFRRILPKIYDAHNIEFRQYTTENFLRTFHGLMLENGAEVNTVYLAVFLSEEILDNLFARNATHALIFLHHPMDMESSNRGFLPIKEQYFLELRRRNISVYSVHTPLDIHESISTSRSIAKVLRLKETRPYNRCSIGYTGIYGTLERKVPFFDFIKSLKFFFGLNEIHYLQKFPMVYKVGIIAGGGAEVPYMQETLNLGCDTYVSGDYLNKVKTKNSLQHRAEFEEIKDTFNMNLIECSHYATEKIVLIHEMRDYFTLLGLETEFIDRKDYWR